MPPKKSAGPKLLAGFTDVPSIGIATRWISTRVKPIDSPANPFGARSLVEPKMTSKNMKVKTISAINADVIL